MAKRDKKLVSSIEEAFCYGRIKFLPKPVICKQIKNLEERLLERFLKEMATERNKLDDEFMEELHSHF